MRTLRYNSPGFSSALHSLKRDAEAHPQVRKTVQDVLEAIRTEGDSALLEFTERFGGPRLTNRQLRLSGKTKVDGDTKRAIATAHANVLAFARKSLRENWTMKNAQGGLVGERFDPFRRVGIYVPGGTAPLVSTAVMTVTFAQAARVPEIVVTTPASVEPASPPAHPQRSSDGNAPATINAALLCALDYAGATEIY